MGRAIEWLPFKEVLEGAAAGVPVRILGYPRILLADPPVIALELVARSSQDREIDIAQELAREIGRLVVPREEHQTADILHDGGRNPKVAKGPPGPRGGPHLVGSRAALDDSDVEPVRRDGWVVVQCPLNWP